MPNHPRIISSPTPFNFHPSLLHIFYILFWLQLFFHFYPIFHNSIQSETIYICIAHPIYNDNFSNLPELMCLWKKDMNREKLGPQLDGLQTSLPYSRTLNYWARSIWERIPVAQFSAFLNQTFLSACKLQTRKGERKWSWCLLNTSWLLWTRTCFTCKISSYPNYNLKRYYSYPHFTNNWGSKLKAFKLNQTGHMGPMIFPELLSDIVDHTNIWHQWYLQW